MLDCDSMNIDEAKEGNLVKFSYPKNGYEHHQEKAAQYLTAGEVYTIYEVVIDSWHTDVYLKEFPGVAFNSVMFSDV